MYYDTYGHIKTYLVNFRTHMGQEEKEKEGYSRNADPCMYYDTYGHIWTHLVYVRTHMGQEEKEKEGYSKLTE